ncbi:mucin-7-like [Sinocyclocheilus grahami]|uniref:mucin-7-like n=1 Tax=Sinocyclocheilus grahami TaxID=75366 RepID=UPI0007AD470B|nr:PREDICTED: mucin-7-like [Sinocyclocheilus grahami]
MRDVRTALIGRIVFPSLSNQVTGMWAAQSEPSWWSPAPSAPQKWSSAPSAPPWWSSAPPWGSSLPSALLLWSSALPWGSTVPSALLWWPPALPDPPWPLAPTTLPWFTSGTRPSSTTRAWPTIPPSDPTPLRQYYIKNLT